MKRVFFYIFLLLLILFFGFSPSRAQQGRDNTNPDPPELLFVTVDISNITGNTILKWVPSDSLDVDGYLIFKPDISGFGWVVIYKVMGRLTDTFSMPGSEPYKRSECYRICAEDYSGNRSSMSPVDGSHCSMYAFPYFDRCSASILLDWNPYEGWDSVSVYKIFCMKQPETGYTYLGQVPGNQSSFLHENILSDIQYCYYVEAEHPDGRISHSNQTCVVPVLPVAPQYLVADYATVASDDAVTVSFRIDKQAEISQYTLYRADSENDAFYNIKSFESGSPANIVYEDKDLDIRHGYCYKLVATDICNREIRTSNLACIMHLSAKSRDDLTYSLTWNRYRDFAGGVKKYNIYREAQNYAPELVKSTDVSQLPGFEDNVSMYTKEQFDAKNSLTGQFCYYIEAVEDSGLNPLHVENRSKSTKACDILKPRVFVPNCIYPNSEVEQNRVFLPYVIYPSQGYSLRIYNRWGEKIFETGDPCKGWDAKMKGGSLAPFGVYVYYLTFVDADGELYRKSGEFTVFHK